MSEYQYYEFQAIDRPLDAAEQAALRALSTRARITATGFVNHYEWGGWCQTKANGSPKTAHPAHLRPHKVHATRPGRRSGFA